MRNTFVQRAVVVVAASVFMVTFIRAGDKDEKDQKIPLDQLPPAIKASAEGAVKGLVLTSAESETKKSGLVYEVKGTADGKKYEIKLSGDAKVIKIEADDDDDDDDDNDDDDNDKKKKGKGIKPEAPKEF